MEITDLQRRAEQRRSDAELFTKLCGFDWMIGNVVPLIFDVQADIYNRHGINFNTLSHLETIGLIQFNNVANFNTIGLTKRVAVHYYGKLLLLDMPKDTDNQLNMGKAILTRIGEELAPICGSTPVDGFYEYVKEQWRDYVPATEKH